MANSRDVHLAIQTKRAGAFSRRWVEYCRQRGVRYTLVDCFRPDAIESLRGLDGLLWHFCHFNATDLLMARHVLTAAEALGLVVFPNWATAWHFDDKIAQKYILEAIGAPMPATWVFYDEASAAEWLANADYPLVWKLRRGAGSHNVRLIHSIAEAKAICGQAFGAGFNPVPKYFAETGERVRRIKGVADFARKLRRFPHAFARWFGQHRGAVRERGYVMFQEFMPDNTTDTRITVIGERAFGFVRNVRRNDFRASGSGSLDYDRNLIDPRCVERAFGIAGTLGSQTLALDFVKAKDGQPVVVEISYGFVPEYVHDSGGYWTRAGEWIPGDFWPEHLILDDLLAAIKRKTEGVSSPMSAASR